MRELIVFPEVWDILFNGFDPIESLKGYDYGIGQTYFPDKVIDFGMFGKIFDPGKSD
jgi:hypothetical protein